MPRGPQRDAIAKLVEPLARERGLELVDVEYHPGPRRSLLRFILDRPGGVSLDDLAEFSGEAGDLLDAHDAVPGSYQLECSSPGVNRPLKSAEDFARYQGKSVRVRTTEPIVGTRNFRGRLIAASAGSIEIEDSTHGRLEVPIRAIERASYEHDFGSNPKGAR